jgi:hypothetical protein
VSRHDLSTETIEVVVGWDPPMNTYFVQVWDKTLDKTAPASELLWIGFHPNEITDVEHVREAVAPWVQLPGDVIRALYAEAHS